MVAALASDRRLDDDEMDAWLPTIRLVQLLPQVLDRALRDEIGINHARYAILVMLAENGDRATMTELARIAGLSRSRLSHALDTLEERGWVTRTWCRTDKRTLSAQLTPAGLDLLRSAAPVHVRQIRELVLGPLSSEEREQLASILGKILPGVADAL